MRDDTLILRCSCSDLGHAIRIGVWDTSGDVPSSFYLEVCTSGIGFWRRVRAAFAHIFTCSGIVYGDVIVCADDAASMRDWIADRVSKQEASA